MRRTAPSTQPRANVRQRTVADSVFQIQKMFRDRQRRIRLERNRQRNNDNRFIMEIDEFGDMEQNAAAIEYVNGDIV